MPRPKEIDFPFKIREKELWRLDLPVEEILLSELEHNLDIPYLESHGTDDWNLTPRQLLKRGHKEPEHYDRVEKADLDYPIIIYHFGGSWKILDGVHRFCKAYRDGHKTIMVKKFCDKIFGF